MSNQNLALADLLDATKRDDPEHRSAKIKHLRSTHAHAHQTAGLISLADTDCVEPKFFRETKRAVRCELENTALNSKPEQLIPVGE